MPLVSKFSAVYPAARARRSGSAGHAAGGDSSGWERTELASELVRELRVVLLQHARVVRVGVGHGDHRVRLAGLRVARVVDASHADAERDREGGLVRGEGHLVQDHALQVALVLSGAAQVHELALRTPPARTRTVGAVCGSACGVGTS
ncbi:MAG: hypothetical protein CL844_05555 [Crocinitomicaceae bacterium]|nr:hypothetical protein [Crocinitomicaceae bacterium]